MPPPASSSVPPSRPGRVRRCPSRVRPPRAPTARAPWRTGARSSAVGPLAACLLSLTLASGCGNRGELYLESEIDPNLERDLEPLVTDDVPRTSPADELAPSVAPALVPGDATEPGGPAVPGLEPDPDPNADADGDGADTGPDGPDTGPDDDVSTRRRVRSDEGAGTGGARADDVDGIGR